MSTEIHKDVFGIDLDDDVIATATCVWYGTVKVSVNGTQTTKTVYYDGPAKQASPAQTEMVKQYCQEFYNG